MMTSSNIKKSHVLRTNGLNIALLHIILLRMIRQTRLCQLLKYTLQTCKNTSFVLIGVIKKYCVFCLKSEKKNG